MDGIKQAILPLEMRRLNVQAMTAGPRDVEGQEYDDKPNSRAGRRGNTVIPLLPTPRHIGTL